MKNYIATLSITFILSKGVIAQNINSKNELFGSPLNTFYGSYKEFTEAAAKQTKPVMILFCRLGCHSCGNLRRGLANPEIAQFFNNFFFTYLIDVNKEKYKLFPLTEKFKITGTPYFIFTAADGRELYRDDIHPNKDSLIETCANVLHKCMDMQRFLLESNFGIDTGSQVKNAQVFVKRYNMENINLSPRQCLEYAFTLGEPRLAIFNEAFIQFATESKNDQGLLVSVVTTQNKEATVCKASKRALKWKEWAEE